MVNAGKPDIVIGLFMMHPPLGRVLSMKLMLGWGLMNFINWAGKRLNQTLVVERWNTDQRLQNPQIYYRMQRGRVQLFVIPSQMRNLRNIKTKIQKNAIAASHSEFP